MKQQYAWRARHRRELAKYGAPMRERRLARRRRLRFLLLVLAIAAALVLVSAAMEARAGEPVEVGQTLVVSVRKGLHVEVSSDLKNWLVRGRFVRLENYRWYRVKSDL